VGNLSYRQDGKTHEYWDGANWVGLTRTKALSARQTASDATDKALTTTESAAHAKCSVSLKNPSAIYNMFWYMHADYSVAYTWNAAGINVVVRHYVQQDALGAGSRYWSRYTSNGSGINFSGVWPVRSGTIGPNATIKFTTWLTLYRSSGSGVATFTNGTTDITIMGVTTIP